MGLVRFMSFNFAGAGFLERFGGASVAFHLWHNLTYIVVFISFS
jgi:hypothetical protein